MRNDIKFNGRESGKIIKISKLLVHVIGMIDLMWLFVTKGIG